MRSRRILAAALAGAALLGVTRAGGQSSPPPCSAQAADQPTIDVVDVDEAQSSQDSVGSLNVGTGQGEFWAVAPDGSILQGNVYVGAKQGDPAVGNGPIGAGSGCLFTGRAFGS